MQWNVSYVQYIVCILNKGPTAQRKEPLVSTHTLYNHCSASYQNEAEQWLFQFHGAWWAFTQWNRPVWLYRMELFTARWLHCVSAGLNSSCRKEFHGGHMCDHQRAPCVLLLSDVLCHEPPERDRKQFQSVQHHRYGRVQWKINI